MYVRPILTGILSLLLTGGLFTACDGEKKTDDKKADAKTDETKTDDAKAEAGEAAAADAGEAAAEAGEAAADAGEAAAESGEAAADAGEAAAEAGEAAAEAGDDAAMAADDGDMKADEGDDGEAEAADGGKKDGGSKKSTKKDKPEPAAKVDAKGIFLKKCKSCHGVKGDADTKLGKKHDIADWTKPGWKGKWPQAKVENIITNGKSGTKMKAFKDKLTPAEIKAVAKYSRSLGK